MLNATNRSGQRIERRCITPVVTALASGQITVSAATKFLRMDADEQAVELGRRIAIARQREERNRLAAATIRRYLDGLGERKVDLIELTGIIRKTLA